MLGLEADPRQIETRERRAWQQGFRAGIDKCRGRVGRTCSLDAVGILRDPGSGCVFTHLGVTPPSLSAFRARRTGSREATAVSR